MQRDALHECETLVAYRRGLLSISAAMPAYSAEDGNKPDRHNALLEQAATSVITRAIRRIGSVDHSSNPRIRPRIKPDAIRRPAFISQRKRHFRGLGF